MVLEALTKVVHADNGVEDGKQNEENRNDSKGCEGFGNGRVGVLVAWLVDTDKLEKKIAETAKKENGNCNHSWLVFAASEECSGEKDDNRNGNSGDGQGEFNIGGVGDNDDKLDNESKEEEEIELEQSNVDLRHVKVCFDEISYEA